MSFHLLILCLHVVPNKDYCLSVNDGYASSKCTPPVKSLDLIRLNESPLPRLTYVWPQGDVFWIIKWIVVSFAGVFSFWVNQVPVDSFNHILYCYKSIRNINWCNKTPYRPQQHQENVSYKR